MAKKGKETETKEVDPFDIEDVAPQGDTLDRSRHFGTVHGEDKKRFFQDGRYFDYAGNLVKED